VQLRRLCLIGILCVILSSGIASYAQGPLYRKLYYKSVSVDDGPHFICQNCGHDFFDARYGQVKFFLIKDFNALVAFKCPNCLAEYQLFVALHKYEDGSIALCIQKSEEEGAGGIPEDWWVITET